MVSLLIWALPPREILLVSWWIIWVEATPTKRNSSGLVVNYLIWALPPPREFLLVLWWIFWFKHSPHQEIFFWSLDEFSDLSPPTKRSSSGLRPVPPSEQSCPHPAQQSLSMWASINSFKIFKQALGSTKTEHQSLLLLKGGTLLTIYDVMQQLLTGSILLTPELLWLHQYCQGIHLGFYLCADFISCTEQPCLLTLVPSLARGTLLFKIALKKKYL